MLPHRVQNILHSVGEYVTPVLTSNDFRTTGLLTPDEFVAAGDYLTFKFPTWCWEGVGPEGGSKRDYLPAGKQYLMTRRVPCYGTVGGASALPVVSKGEGKGDGDEDGEGVGEGWLGIEVSGAGRVDGAAGAAGAAATSAPPDMDATSAPSDMDATSAQPVAPTANDLYDVDATTVPSGGTTAIITASDLSPEHAINAAFQQGGASCASTGAPTLALRSYDLYLTYDKYYQVPRMWLRGYQADGRLLTPSQMKQDISAEHADKTVTIEPFPWTNVPTLSIHPCQHANVMKALLHLAGESIRVDEYLVLFLKFMACVLPTLDYDHTVAVGSAGPLAAR